MAPKMASKLASLQYNIVYDETAKNSRALLVEEPPTRRLMDWYYRGKEAQLDLPLPWTYTYLRITKTDAGPQLWDTRVFFSAVELDATKLDTAHVSLPYISNVGGDGAVCWGSRGFSYDLPTRIDQSVPYCLNAFWFRSFNAELTPGGPYYEAVAIHVKTLGTRNGRLSFLRRVEKLSLEELLAIPVTPNMALVNQVWLPTLKPPVDAFRNYARHDTYSAHRILAAREASYRASHRF